MAEKRYYWLKLKDDFFDEKYIKALRKLPQGDSLIIIYLKMQLKSLKTEGYIYYEEVLPDSITELSLALDEDENLTRLAVEALIKFGVIEQLDNETFYMVALQKLIGSETQAAERQRKHRELNKRDNVTDLRDNVTLEKDIEKEIDIELEGEKKPPTAPPLTTEEKELLISEYGPENVERYIAKIRNWKKRKGMNPDVDCETLRKWLDEDKASLKLPSMSAHVNCSFDVNALEQSAYERYRKKDK